MEWLVRANVGHESLVAWEFQSLLPSVDFGWPHPMLTTFKASSEQIEFLLQESVNVRYLLSRPYFVKLEDIKSETLTSLPVDHWINTDDHSFVVRSRHVASRESHMDSPDIERYIGSIIYHAVDIPVSLKHADVTILVISFDDQLVIGRMEAEITHDSIEWRAPKNSPYFGGGGMKSHLCRTLVNLLTPKDPVIFDPFAGHGGILNEIASSHSFAVGCEIHKKVIREAKVNTYHYNFDAWIALIHADSLRPPFRKGSFRQIVTDPPYAIQTTTLRRDLETFLTQWLNLQHAGTLLVMTTPNDKLAELPDDWEVDINETDYVHNKLFRRVRRMRKQ